MLKINILPSARSHCQQSPSIYCFVKISNGDAFEGVLPELYQIAYPINNQYSSSYSSTRVKNKELGDFNRFSLKLPLNTASKSEPVDLDSARGKHSEFLIALEKSIGQSPHSFSISRVIVGWSMKTSQLISRWTIKMTDWNDEGSEGFCFHHQTKWKSQKLEKIGLW